MYEFSSASPEQYVDPQLLMERYAQHPLAGLETYKFYNQTGELAAESRTRFSLAVADGDMPEAPIYSYDKIDADQLMEWRDSLTELADDISRCDPTVESNLLLRENITNRLGEIGIMLLTKLQSEMSPSDPRYNIVSFQLGQNMREIYGVPEAQHWQGVLGYRLQQLSRVEERSDVPAAVLEAWEYIKLDLPSGLPVEEPYTPRQETIEWYREQLDTRLAPARQVVAEAIESGEITLDEDGKLDGLNIVKATRIALAARGAQPWTAELTDEANIDTTQALQTIFVPKTRKMDMQQFDGVMQSHEIDYHVMTRVNGDATGDPILGGTGCNGYLSWNEGNGKANEALLKGKAATQTSAFSFYLSGGLALGLDGRPRNHPETHALVWRMNFVDAYLKGKIDGQNVNTVKLETITKATKSMDRLFRGTDGRAPGVVFTKDALTYYLGQVQVWRKWDNDMQLPEGQRIVEHQLERSAKIDPLRQDHRRVAIAAFQPALIR